MRPIVHITNLTGPEAGGLAHSVPALVRALREHGLAVEAAGSKPWTQSSPSWSGLGLKCFGVVGPTVFSYMPGFAGHLRRLDPALVHVHGLWSYASIAARRMHARGVPLVVSPRGMLDAWALEQSALRKKVSLLVQERPMLNSCSFVHALCDQEYRSIRALGVRAPIAVIPNGVDLGTLPGHSYRYAGDIVFLSRLHPKKNVAALIEAWNRVPDPCKRGRALVIAGSGEPAYVSSLQALAAADVRLVGEVHGPAKAALLLGASALVLPSLSEGLPMAVLEAWAHGVPVLMSAHCNIPEGFGAGAALDCGTSVESIAQTVRAFLDLGEQKGTDMASRAVCLIEDRYRWDRIAEQVASAYEWALGCGAKPDCVRLA